MNAEEIAMERTGECFCGAVRYRVEGAIKDARSCHCSRCRKAFGGAASAYAEVDHDLFEWTAGEELLSAYEWEEGSGKLFCSRCGSFLAARLKHRIHGIAIATLNDDEGIAPPVHYYVASKAAWDVIPEGVEAYDEMPPDVGSA